VTAVELYSFRVSCREPGTDEMKVDDFILAEPAVRCAERLHHLGWADVRCEEIHVSDPGTPHEAQFVARVLYPIQTPAGSSPMSDSDLAPLGKP
jgi:hypothetical protein